MIYHRLAMTLTSFVVMAVSYALELLEVLIKKDILVLLDKELTGMGGYYEYVSPSVVGTITLKRDIWARPNTFIHEVTHLCQHLLLGDMGFANIVGLANEKEYYFWMENRSHLYPQHKWGYEMEADICGYYRVEQATPKLIEILETRLFDVHPEDSFYAEETMKLRNSLL